MGLAAVMLTVSAAAQIHFTNVGAASNTLVRCNTHGSGFFDADQNGWDDIFVVHNSSLGEYVHLPNTLLKNLTTGIFQNVTDAAGVQGYLDISSQGLAAADYNNDGRMDICIGMGNRYYQALLYRQNSDFTFTDISGWAIRDQGTLQGRNLAFLDYDRNGWLDLLLLKDDLPDNPSDFCLTLYRNRQNGSYENVTIAAGLNLAPSANDLYGFAVADADNNGYPDIYVPRLSGASLYLVNVNGVFHESSVAAGLPHGSNYLGAVFLDYNNDGYWDLFLKRQDASVQLFTNDRDGTFTNVTTAAGLSGIDTGHLPGESGFGGGLTSADFDNNGWADILVINRYGTENKLLMNNGDGTFSDRASSAGLLEHIDYYWSSPVADYNRDGYLDIYMARSPGGDPSAEDAALYRNDGGSAHWFFARLTGVTSNRSAVGARLDAHVNGGLQIRQVLGGDGYKASSFWNHFGLGAAEAVDSLVVRWPSGIIQKATEIQAGTFLELTEKDTVQYYGPPYIGGTVRHFKSAVPVPGVQTHLTGDLTLNATTDADGRYRLKPVPLGAVNLTVTPEKTRGDDVGDNGVTAFDAALTLRWIAGLEPLTDLQKSSADVDNDGSIEALDAALIARYAVGIRDDSQSLAGSWRFTPSSREYTQLVRENDPENYECNVLGDVTENWGDPEIPGKAATGAAPSCPATLSISDTVFDVPLSINGRTEMLAADVRLKFDPSRLELLEAVPAGPASGFSIAANEESPGLLKVALYGAAPVAAPGTVLNIRFRQKDRTPQPLVFLWERIAVNEHDFGPATTTALPAGKEEGEKPGGFGIRSNYPNPFNPGTTVVYSVDRDAETRLVLFDSRGREVRILFHGRQNPGEYRVEWNGLDGRGSEAPPGLYFCRLTAGPESQVIKLLKVK
jgi:hypothetical protein